jgi:flagellar basal-body rod protein FlgC
LTPAGVGSGGGVRGLFRGLDIASSGLSAQRRRIEVVASNIANAETTRTAEGGPYRRRHVELAAGPVAGEQWPGVVRAGESPVRIRAGEVPGMGEGRELGVAVQNVWEDPTEGPMVYDPSHPDADETGYVRYPNVRVTDELVTMMEARRLYEANATVFDAVKAMLRRATEI